MDFVDHHQLDAGGCVGVADGACDLSLGHVGGDGDADEPRVAGEAFREATGRRAGPSSAR